MIPEQICGTCYHPKSEAKTCTVPNCEVRAAAKYRRALALYRRYGPDYKKLATFKTTKVDFEKK